MAKIKIIENFEKKLGKGTLIKESIDEFINPIYEYIDRLAITHQPVRSASGVTSYVNRLATRSGEVVTVSLSGQYSEGVGNKILGTLIGSMIPTTPGGRHMEFLSLQQDGTIITRIASIDGTGNITCVIGRNDVSFILSAIYKVT